MKRIVKITDIYNNVHYRVESNRIFGFIPCEWHTCTDYVYTSVGNMACDAIYKTYDEALAFIVGTLKVTKEEVVYEERI